MKKFLLLFLVAGSIAASAQTNSTPDGFTTGYLINSSNDRLEGSIKESFKKGTISFNSTSGISKNYTPSEINEFAIGQDVYLAYMNDFYKVTSAGTKGSLLQKVTNNKGKMLYNGSDAYAATTTDGKIGDFYLKIKSTEKVALVTKQNFEKVFASFCGDCTALQANILAKQLDYSTLDKAVEQYNNCN